MRLSCVISTEFKQSFSYWFFLIVICFFTGLSLFSAERSFKKVLDLIHVEDWQADLVILPKGKSLEDFRKELLSGESRSYLPETLFQTTASLAEKKFQLQGVLPVQGTTGVLVLHEGDSVGTQWLPPTTHFIDWNEDLISTTHPVWQKKLLAGIIAKGNPEQMRQLKNLIDQRTVAQAFYIQDEQKKMLDLTREIKNQMYSFLFILAGLIIVGSCLIYLTLKERLRQIAIVFKENFLSSKIYVLIGVIIAGAVITPVIMGYLILTLLT